MRISDWSSDVCSSDLKPEDKYPKLVLRSDDDAEPAAEGPGKEAPLKVGTVSVPNDRFKVDPRKYEVTYYPFAESFTTNLADGSGFLQIGISVSTFYDGTVLSSEEHTSELPPLIR